MKKYKAHKERMKMKNIYIRILVSFILGFLVAWGFLWVFSFIFNTGDVVGITMGIAVISTIIFCTFTILEEMKKFNTK